MTSLTNAVPNTEDLPPRLSNLVSIVGEYHVVDDLELIVCPLAVAATSEADAPPVWLQVVGNASSGKTEAIDLVGSSAVEQIDDITVAGLLSWSRTEPSVPVGLLTKLQGSKGLVVIRDFSSVLAMSDRGGRDQLYATLRSAYDGKVMRRLGNMPEALIWEGRLTLVSACTHEIDRHSAHADSLGPRWVYFRCASRPFDKRVEVGRKARGSMEKKKLLTPHAVRLADEIVRDARVRLSTTVNAALADVIDDAAVATCYGRAAIERDGYGRREVVGIPQVEESPRLVKQLTMLAAGASAIGLSNARVIQLVRRVARDSMPLARSGVLEALNHSSPATVQDISRALGWHRGVVSRSVEELESVGLVECEEDGSSGWPKGKPRPCRLADTDQASAVRKLFNLGSCPEV